MWTCDGCLQSSDCIAHMQSSRKMAIGPPSHQTKTPQNPEHLRLQLTFRTITWSQRGRKIVGKFLLRPTASLESETDFGLTLLRHSQRGGTALRSLAACGRVR